MSGARWAVKLKSGEYACVTCRVGCCRVSYDTPSRIENHGKARAVAKRRSGKVVRLLTPAESRRKAQAEALREAACDARARADDRLRNYADWRGQSAHLIDADALDAQADALWPRKGAGRPAPTRGKWMVGEDGLAREVGGL